MSTRERKQRGTKERRDCGYDSRGRHITGVTRKLGKDIARLCEGMRLSVPPMRLTTSPTFAEQTRPRDARRRDADDALPGHSLQLCLGHAKMFLCGRARRTSVM